MASNDHIELTDQQWRKHYPLLHQYFGRTSQAFHVIWSPDAQERVLEMFSEGASLDEVAAELGVVKATMYEWLSSSDEAKQQFGEVIRIGVQLAKAWWDKRGRDALGEKQFNARVWEANMRNRYAWFGFGDEQRVGVLALESREHSDVESVKETVNVTEIIARASREAAMDVEYEEVDPDPPVEQEVQPRAAQEPESEDVSKPTPPAPPKPPKTRPRKPRPPKPPGMRK